MSVRDDLLEMAKERKASKLKVAEALKKYIKKQIPALVADDLDAGLFAQDIATEIEKRAS